MARVIVTGASSGIGRACVSVFHSAGYEVLAAGRDATRTAAAVEGLAGAQAWTGDLTQPGACEDLAEAAEARWGALDCLVNAAGVIFRRTVEETSDAEWRATLSVNLDAAFFLSRACLPLLRKAGGGSIQNIASDWGVSGGARAAAYCASKGGLVLLSRAMARDHAREGIRVNAVCPGDVDTPMLTKEAEQRGLSAGEGLAEANEDSPTGRVTSAEEVARLTLYLASDAARQITGAAYVIDGGATA
jgi:meso-butanediol dehydrogenase/(S,S)-butanediol dehydrogenase/diacetyl reductase